MALIEPNFDEMIKPIGAGVYDCRIEDCEPKTSSNGNPYVKWKLSTLPDQHSIYYNTPINGRGAGMLKHFIHSASDEKYQGGAFDTDMLIGCVVSCEIELEDYQGKLRPRVRSIKKRDITQVNFKQFNDVPF